MKISEVIKELKRLEKEHGDIEVFSGGEDYPSVVGGLRYSNKSEAYYSNNCIKIDTRGF